MERSYRQVLMRKEADGLERGLQFSDIHMEEDGRERTTKRYTSSINTKM